MHVFFIQKLDIISKEANAKFGSKNRVPPFSTYGLGVRYICSAAPVVVTSFGGNLRYEMSYTRLVS